MIFIGGKRKKNNTQSLQFSSQNIGAMVKKEMRAFRQVLESKREWENLENELLLLLLPLPIGETNLFDVLIECSGRNIIKL